MECPEVKYGYEGAEDGHVEAFVGVCLTQEYSSHVEGGHEQDVGYSKDIGLSLDGFNKVVRGTLAL